MSSGVLFALRVVVVVVVRVATRRRRRRNFDFVDFTTWGAADVVDAAVEIVHYSIGALGAN